LSDLRSIPRTKYQCPAVEIGARVTLDDVRRAALEARASGLIVARDGDSALVVVPRDAAVAAMGIAESLQGSLRTASLAELRGRSLEAV
jgi:hypothetical protein